MLFRSDGRYSNESQTQRVFIKIYEYDSASGERWVTIKWFEINLPACQGLEAPSEVLADDPDGRFILVDGACDWEGRWTYDAVKQEWIAPESGPTDDGDGGGLGTGLLAGIGAAVLIVIILSLLVLRRGGDDEVKSVDFAMGTGGYADALDPVEQYVQQLVAQGYPEDTARAHAAQYASQLGGAAAAPAAEAAAPAAGSGLYEQYYQQYYAQLTQQGYDAATASQYAAQYAQQALQQQ